MAIENKTTKQSSYENLMQLMSFTAEKALELSDANSILGERIEIDGTVIIPVSKVSTGFAGGGASITNVAAKKSNVPSGSGAKVTVTPMSFLVVSEGKVSLININVPEKASKKNIIMQIIDTVKGLKKNKKPDEADAEAEE